MRDIIDMAEPLLRRSLVPLSRGRSLLPPLSPSSESFGWWGRPSDSDWRGASGDNADADKSDAGVGDLRREGRGRAEPSTVGEVAVVVVVVVVDDDNVDEPFNGDDDDDDDDDDGGGDGDDGGGRCS